MAFIRVASPAIIFAYFVMIGGSAIGEVYPAVRALNMVLTIALIATWALMSRRGYDRVDLAVTSGLILFILACVASEFPRQSFDVAWMCTAYAVSFSIARRLVSNLGARRMLLVAMAALSLMFGAFTAVRWLGDVATWVSVVGWQLPPLDIPFATAPWGHRHDVALLVTMLLPAWVLFERNRVTVALACLSAALTAVIVFLDGSRTLWAGIAVATVVIVGRSVWPHVARITRRRPSVAVALAIVAIAVLVFSGISDRILNLRTIAARGELWQASIDAWLAHPLAGHGPGSFPWVLQLTGYFDTNSWAPRHPDNAVVQLLAEAGIVGVLATSVIVLTILTRLWTSKPAAWALICFGTACLGANPTDFGFLVSVAIGWASVAMPFTGSDGRLPTQNRLMNGRLTWAIGLALLPIAAAMALASIAELAYLHAAQAIEVSAWAAAKTQLGVAVSLDPKLALYQRTLGLVDWELGGPAASLDHLQVAVDLNGSDDLAYRSIAAAAWLAGDRERAEGAIATAVRLQRSDTNNTLLAAEIEGKDGGQSTLELAAETLQAYPTLALSRDWTRYAMSVGSNPGDIAIAAANRWEASLPSTQPPTVQGLWLSAIARRDDLVARAERESTLPPQLAAAVSAALRCNDQKAEEMIREAASPRETYYWSVRSALAARSGTSDESARAILGVLTGRSAAPTDRVDVLSENTAPGFSLDAWGYQRPTIIIRGLAVTLPSPSSGLTEWMSSQCGRATSDNDSYGYPSAR